MAIVSPLVVPPEFGHQFKLAIVVLCGIVVTAMMREHGRAAQVASAVALPADAVVLREGPANFKDGWVMVGGILKLTPEKLVFSAHGFAQSARVRAWDLHEFAGTTPARALGLVPNAILVRFGPTEIKLVVTEREAWLEAIRSAAANLGRAKELPPESTTASSS